MPKKKWYEPKKVKKLALNSQLPTVQILTNDVQVIIFCLSYSINEVLLVLYQNIFSISTMGSLKEPMQKLQKIMRLSIF